MRCEMMEQETKEEDDDEEDEGFDVFSLHSPLSIRSIRFCI